MDDARSVPTVPAVPAAPAVGLSSAGWVENWSGTHRVCTRSLYAPETVREAERYVASARGAFRPAGSLISPNGLSLAADEMVSMALCDRKVWVDRARGLARFEAGCRVSGTTSALAAEGLVLENFASIADQQLGGFTQAGAHGTGARLGPADAQVVGLRVATPGLGVLELDDESGVDRADVPAWMREEKGALFRLVRQGLGTLGLVTEVTMRCVPRHRLRETTEVLSRAEVRTGHAERLRRHRHLRYLWIPYVDAVVVVSSDVVEEGEEGVWGADLWSESFGGSAVRLADGEEAYESVLAARRRATATKALWRLWLLVDPPAAQAAIQDWQRAHGGGGGGNNNSNNTNNNTNNSNTTTSTHSPSTSYPPVSFAALRDAILHAAPLDPVLVRSLNAAEAEYWRGVQGVRVAFSDQVLGFECGGQQLVSEVALPAGSAAEPSLRDLDTMDRLMRTIEAHNIPSPAPIEMRWTAPSSSALSPVFSQDPLQVFAWIGVIMYLPTHDPPARARVTEAFRKYEALLREHVFDHPDTPPVTQHWAKLEVREAAEPAAPGAHFLDPAARARARFLRRWAPGTLQRYREARALLDPENLLGRSNPILRAVLEE